MKLVKLFLFALCVGNSCSALTSYPYRRHHVSMLRSVIITDNLPTTLVMLTKWSLAERMEFTRNIGYLSQFQSMKENVTISQDINPNTVVLVIDLDADGSMDYLETVKFNRIGAELSCFLIL